MKNTNLYLEMPYYIVTTKYSQKETGVFGQVALAYVIGDYSTPLGKIPDSGETEYFVWKREYISGQQEESED